MTNKPEILAADDNHELRMRPALYAAAFAAIQVIVLVAVLAISATPWFLTHDAYPGMYQSGYSLRLRHADCEVLIYGDSSALTGLDPQIIQSMTGLKTCNISEGTTIQEVVGSSFPLDRYLADNHRPRYLLAMYTPSIYRPYTPPMAQYHPEGVLYALQYDRHPRMLMRLHHSLIDYDLWAGRGMILDVLERLHLTPEPHKDIDTRAQRAARQGVWPYPLPPETHCIRQTYGMKADEFKSYPESAAKMRELYAVDGTTVLLDVAPAAECDPLWQTYRDRDAGLHDNAFEVWPISDFNEGDVHFSTVGGRRISIEAGEQILALERQRSSAGAQGTR